MLSWISFGTVHLISSWIIIFTSHPLEVKTIADKEDSGAAFIFLFVVCAAFISLFAIVFLLLSLHGKQNIRSHIILAFASVFCSWVLIHTLFTLRYAHLYYSFSNPATEAGEQQDALGFPGDEEPDYFDFAYFSFVLGMTFQVSDVIIRSRKIRRMALLHGFLSFVYNTVIVALSINIVSAIITS